MLFNKKNIIKIILFIKDFVIGIPINKISFKMASVLCGNKTIQFIIGIIISIIISDIIIKRIVCFIKSKIKNNRV